jgi:hypothetical protein
MDHAAVLGQEDDQHHHQDDAEYTLHVQPDKNIQVNRSFIIACVALLERAFIHAHMEITVRSPTRVLDGGRLCSRRGVPTVVGRYEYVAGIGITGTGWPWGWWWWWWS